MIPSAISEKLLYKKQLKERCIAILTERIEEARLAMNNAQEAANSEEKSSAGDKYEVGRAMSQIDRDRSAVQLDQLLYEMSLLQGINVDEIYSHVKSGAIMSTGSALFFIATGIGITSMGSHKVAVLSPRSPFAVAMLGKKAGDNVIFTGNNFIISEVF